MLTVDTIPLVTLPIDDFRLPMPAAKDQLEIGNWKSEMSFRFFVIRVLAAAPAKLTEFQPLRGRFLVLGRDVVAAFAIRALKYDVVARHNSKSPISLSDQLAWSLGVGFFKDLRPKS